MRLFAVISPPRGVLDELVAVVRGVRPVQAAPEQRRGLRARFGGRTPVVEETATDELTVPALALMYLPITNFGNVTLGDSIKLTNALRAEASTWAPATVHFAGGTALEYKGDESVWAKLAGDIDALVTIGRGVPRVVERLGFFTDRRQFRPWLSVGTITETTSAAFLEDLVDALETFRGESWTIAAVELMRGLHEEGRRAFEELERLPLAGG